ncbi:putative transmembrane family 234 protein [Helianthus annuus]|nr:putative transmembrane family 234 protein [Helianthus annuus]
MHRSALISDQQLHNKQLLTKNPILKTLIDWFNLILVWQYSLPFIINLFASATFFAILSHTLISLVVLVTNATMFAAIAVFGMLLGEEIRVGLTVFGTFLIVLGVYVCVV